MDRQKLRILAGLAILAGGAWWWHRNRGTEAAGVPGFDFAGLPDIFADAFDIVEDVADTAVDTVTTAANGGVWVPPLKAAPYMDAVRAAEAAAGAPANLFARQIWQESRFDPRAVNRYSGAKGIAQFMDATWAEWGHGDVFDAFASIDAMGRYMRWLYERHGDWREALAAYNWGTGNVRNKGMAAAPRETREYVADIAGAVGLA